MRRTEYQKQWSIDNGERIKARDRQYRIDHPLTEEQKMMQRSRSKEYRKNAKEKARIRSAKWREAHSVEWKKYSREYHRLWYRANRQKVKRYVQRWMTANKEYMQEWHRKYAKDNAEEIKAYKHQHYLKNYKRITEYNRLYRARKKAERECGATK